MYVLLAMYIEQEEMKLYKRMKEFGRMNANVNREEEFEKVQYNSVSSVCMIDDCSYEE